VPAHMIRHKVAAAIMSQARQGDLDPEHLRQAALDSLPDASPAPNEQSRRNRKQLPPLARQARTRGTR
jgi:hypothetical protein